jgi:hypothetical protein
MGVLRMGVILTDKWILKRVKELMPTRKQLERAMRESYEPHSQKDFAQALNELQVAYETNIGQFCPNGVDDCGGHYIGLGNTLNNLLNKREEQVRVYNIHHKPADEDEDEYEDMQEPLSGDRRYVIVRENDFSDPMDYWFCGGCADLIALLDGYSLYNVIQETL